MRRFVWLVGSLLVLAPGLQSQTKPVRIVDRIVAQVNDDIITQSEINRELAQARQELAAKFTGEQLEEELKKEEKNILEDLIRQRLFLQKANEMGMGSGMDVQVSAQIEAMRKQYNIKDMEEFEKALESQGMTLASYREYVKKQMIIGSLINTFVDSRITLLSEEVERYYKDHVKDYSSAEEVTLSEILIPIGGNDGQAESLATEYRKRLLKGESFAAMASQYSKGPTAGKGGNIGTYQTAKLSPQIAEPIASVKEGEISQVVKVGDSYAIFRVDSRKAPQVRPFEEVRSEIKNILFMQRQRPEMERFVAQLREDAYIQVFAEIGIGK
jgi:peptidyl-prolyl cis-trans isomerase SurA